MKKALSSISMLTLLFLLALTLTACGNNSDQAQDPTDPETADEGTSGLPLPEIDHWLVITDSIGVELGDSNLVFAQIVGTQFLPDGNIAVADMMKNKISIFSPDGEYITAVGREGSGPGEYLMLSTFAVTEEGGFIVPDAMGGKLNFYDPEYNFTDAMTGFFPTPPIMISPVDGGFVGLKPEFEQTEDEMQTGMGIYLWTDSAAHTVEYVRNMILFDINDLGATVKTMVFFDTDQNDNVLLAPYSTEEYKITSLSPDGEEIWQISEDFPRVRKTTEEIEEERELIRSRMIASGAPAAMAENFQLEEYKVFIGQLEIDNRNRVWVLIGLYDSAVYRVYDCDTGDFLFSAALRADEAHEDVLPVISDYGIMGFNADSDEWPRVYIIQPEDPALFD
ncbi:MAG: 6-bladed beta-propeller [Candidatus Sabulitectum sp.]|nr:6-bladed beta-propeller [Candidatus Sabulitectum sp.]